MGCKTWYVSKVTGSSACLWDVPDDKGIYLSLHPSILNRVTFSTDDNKQRGKAQQYYFVGRKGNDELRRGMKGHLMWTPRRAVSADMHSTWSSTGHLMDGKGLEAIYWQGLLTHATRKHRRLKAWLPTASEGTTAGESWGSLPTNRLRTATLEENRIVGRPHLQRMGLTENLRRDFHCRGHPKCPTLIETLFTP